MSLTPARRVALTALSDVRRRDAWVRPVLDAAIGKAALAREDAAFARALAIGTTQMLGSLDHAIDRFADKPSRIEPRVRDALRMSTYEILFMGTPHEVAVDQGVEAVRVDTPRASGLANAVLRRVSEHADGFPWHDADDSTRLSLLTGHPEWLVEAVETDLGRESARAMLEADNTPPPLYLASNLMRTTDEELAEALELAGAAPRPYGAPGCLEAGDATSAIASGVFDDLRAVASDAGAQVVAQLALPRSHGHIIEIGAGRGTKTIVLNSHARRLDREVRITCVDIDGRKLDVLRERVVAAGYPAPGIFTLDAAAGPFDPALDSTADAVLVDAPCSGLGTLRRHPEKRWTLDPAAVMTLASLGLGMLHNAASLVRPGGFVVYSTCTVLTAENDDVVDAFLASEAGVGFRDETLEPSVPEEFRMWVGDRGRLQSMPTIGGPDGHFAAVLRRDGED